MKNLKCIFRGKRNDRIPNDLPVMIMVPKKFKLDRWSQETWKMDKADTESPELN